MSKFALISVSDRTGLLPFVRGLSEFGLQILSTGGTGEYLKQNGVTVTSVSEYTGQQEILGGRVKTLHPKVHAGILARRNLDSDLQELKLQEIAEIDFVIVNLYPFIEKVNESSNAKIADLVEFIDIGGPTMIRAAAKNYQHVVPVCDPDDYQGILDEMKKTGSVSLATRKVLAGKVFRMMAIYDGTIARAFSWTGEEQESSDEKFPSEKKLAPLEQFVLVRAQELRYGENPHQQASFYRPAQLLRETAHWRQLHGKQLSYNNLLDVEATLDLFLEFVPNSKQVAVIVKHTNPCGVALGATALDAFRKARACDPLSAFGGIVAVSGELDAPLAKSILEGFVEVVISGKVTAEALVVMEAKKNVRVIECDFSEGGKYFRSPDPTIRKALDGYLIQLPDRRLSAIAAGTVVTKVKPDLALTENLEFAWKICKHVKSNAIVIVKDFAAIGVGAGQMSRVDAARIAIERALTHGHIIQGAVASSDAFLPFPDTLEILNDAGITALVQPGGSVKDQEVIRAADLRKMVMVFTGERHFRH